MSGFPFKMCLYMVFFKAEKKKNLFIFHKINSWLNTCISLIFLLSNVACDPLVGSWFQFGNHWWNATLIGAMNKELQQRWTYRTRREASCWKVLNSIFLILLCWSPLLRTMHTGVNKCNANLADRVKMILPMCLWGWVRVRITHISCNAEQWKKLGRSSIWL